jgi:hypothetical protein
MAILSQFGNMRRFASEKENMALLALVLGQHLQSRFC